MTDAITCSVLMCHAPIVVPEVGGAAAVGCSATQAAMREAARCVVAAEPDAIVIISPHAPRSSAWAIATDDLTGDFSQFRAPRVRLSLPADRDAGARIAMEADRLGFGCILRTLGSADHATMVPLYFIAHAGYAGPVIRIALPVFPTTRECELMGRAIATAAELSGQHWAVVASGDMSHRLERGAPSGFHPRAYEFDETIVQAVARGDYHDAADVDTGLRELAAEDVVDTLSVGAAAVSWQSRGHRMLSYEGPFGVGYLVAVLYCGPRPGEGATH